jgi:uncharacterized protein YidB (DUF937 family)
MGMLDQIIAAIGGGQGAQGQPGSSPAQSTALLAGLMKMVNSPAIGGVGGLVAKLQSAGLGSIVSSWIGTGTNQPVTGRQLTSALGEENIEQVAREAGVSREDASSGLASILPGLVDKLSPDGQIPDNVARAGAPGGDDLTAMLGSLFGGQQQQQQPRQ